MISKHMANHSVTSGDNQQVTSALHGVPKDWQVSKSIIFPIDDKEKYAVHYENYYFQMFLGWELKEPWKPNYLRVFFVAGFSYALF